MDPTPWFERAPDLAAPLRMFCFPYAGGDAHIFRGWQKRVPEGVNVCPIYLPGRGRRMAEPRHRRMESLVRAVAEAVAPWAGAPFVLFGHSMGAIISFELARLLDRRFGVSPVRLLVSGRIAPQEPDLDPPTYNLPQREFLLELKRLNGTDEELLANSEAMELLTPIVRADFEAVQTYSFVEGPRLRCPITAYGGLADIDTPRERVESWRAVTESQTVVKMFPDGHFFINARGNSFFQALAEDLQTALQDVKAAGRPPGEGRENRNQTA
ncbi:MAG: thioesterase [Acidobacteriaceae bacterium]|nr:thioesterase [Acidobacteriaceae bacterium]